MIRYLYFFISFVSTLGSESTALVIPLILYAKTEDISLLMIGYSFQMVPIILFGNILQSILVKYNKLTVYAFTDFIQAIFLVIIWVQIQSENFSPNLIVILLIFSAVFSTIHNIVGDYFVLPYITPESQLAFTNSLYSQLISYAGIIAPALVGLFATRNPDILIFDALTFIPSVLFVYFGVKMNFTNRKEQNFEKLDRDSGIVSKGLVQLYTIAINFYKKNRDILLYTIIGVVINFAMSNFYPIMIVSMKEKFNLNQIAISITLVLINILGLLALPLTNWIQKSDKFEKYILLISVIGVVCLFIQDNLAFIIGCAMINIGVIVFNSISTYARQTKIPENIKYVVVIVHKSLISIPYLMVPLFLPKLTELSVAYSYIYIGACLILASILLFKTKGLQYKL